MKCVGKINSTIFQISFYKHIILIFDFVDH